ncbi:peptidylprolyl isomerase [Pseudonocardiaceae bacterium YIM PH 21723]|nr:peptidylprolyl isomerase [Pseudonocardiaceae bacterium YIM PH 21723]
MTRRSSTIALVLALLATGLSTVTAEASPSTVTCTYIPTPEDPAVKPVSPPPAQARNKGTFQLTMETNRGNIELELFRDKAPCTVNSFLHLVREHWYNESLCHRITKYPGRLNVLQCGDPRFDGTYDPKTWSEGGPGYKFGDELSGTETYGAGTLAMANAGPNTNGSQWFLNYQDSKLKPNYTVFGRVTKGLDIIQKVADGGLIPILNPEQGEVDGIPKQKVRIDGFWGD